MTPIVVRWCTAALVGLVAFTSLDPRPAQAADPTGTWLTEDRRARVRTEFCGPGNSHLCGYIVWAASRWTRVGSPAATRTTRTRASRGVRSSATR
jgi:hypothetical protein